MYNTVFIRSEKTCRIRPEGSRLQKRHNDIIASGRTPRVNNYPRKPRQPLGAHAHVQRDFHRSITCNNNITTTTTDTQYRTRTTADRRVLSRGSFLRKLSRLRGWPEVTAVLQPCDNNIAARLSVSAANAPSRRRARRVITYTTRIIISLNDNNAAFVNISNF